MVSLALFWEIVSQADGWLLNWLDRARESYVICLGSFLATTARSPRVLAIRMGPRNRSTIRREWQLQEDVGWKFVSSNPSAGSRIFSPSLHLKLPCNSWALQVFFKWGIWNALRVTCERCNLYPINNKESWGRPKRVAIVALGWVTIRSETSIYRCSYERDHTGLSFNPQLLVDSLSPNINFIHLVIDLETYISS